ncbi:MAG TPA: hypothetical protein VFI28_09780 [Candidatus Limnocylindrales bacterium]|nr:hypothetical protein [Candidatus Limnocylindrales bacterium]
MGGWALPEARGGIRVPWVALIVGPDLAPEVVTIERVEEPGDGSARLAGRSRAFEIESRWCAPDGIGARDVTVSVTCTASESTEASVGISLLLAPSAEPWFLVPGLFYGENRPRACRRLYPRWAAGSSDGARFESDRWAFRSDRAAVPVVVASDGRWTAALATTETSELGATGLAFSADADATGVGLFAPFHEQPVVYDGSATAKPGVVTFRRFEPAETVTFRCRAYVAPPDRYAFAPILRDLHRRLAASSALRPWVGLEHAAALAAEGLVRWHYRPDEAAIFETAAFEREAGDAGGPARDAPGDRAAMHVAWLSGVTPAFALLLHGRRAAMRDAHEAATRVIDNVVANASPSGLLWGQWSRAGGWGKGWAPGANALHGRTLGEASLFLCRALRLELGFGARHDAWRDALRAGLDVASRAQADDGRLATVLDGRTGVARSFEGSAGLGWVPAFVESARLLDVRAWLDVARRAGEAYAPFVDAAFLHGAPEDVDLAPSSEDGYVALMAYVALFEAATDEPERARWLDLARRSADWLLTFRYAYDVTFDPATLLGRYGFASRGADQASPANQHLHLYGLICTPELVRLSRAVGDPWYAVRAAEHLAAARQFIAREDADFNARRGMAPERLYQTDSFGPKGGLGPLSHAWVLGLLLYAAEVALDLPELADPELDGGIASSAALAGMVEVNRAR